MVFGEFYHRPNKMHNLRIEIDAFKNHTFYKLYIILNKVFAVGEFSQNALH